MDILAHRANWRGPSATENTRASVVRCLMAGWGLALDIRRDASGTFYISHGPAAPDAGHDADAILGLVRAHTRATLALNVREPGYEADLLKYLDGFDLWDRMFLFDMERREVDTAPTLETGVTLETGMTLDTRHELDGRVACAARASDRNEPLDQALRVRGAKTIWFDELDLPWVTAADIERAHQSGCLAYVVSPDLHGGTLEAARARWESCIAWGVDGICTDYAAALGVRMRRSA